MTSQNSELVRVWAFRLSLGTTLIVVVLSWSNAVKLFDLVVRAGVSFGVMFLLLAGILSLFEKTALPVSQNGTSDSVSGRGSFIDVSVGEEDILGSQASDSGFPGQVDPSLSNGILDGEQQAEIVRRMGWG
ncbi:hypothetical protein [Desulfosporosinus metallidurans]|uniref:Uncharacterized protein n=1 Tax=Desulfosporosinus metallidurans TaxID=1888891 RepID=A0A1Q8R1G3_9FIRM|nr:hypothetical protein [Desulfosporosinus metallidurans]OLN33483.1 hypothetical protein DSOL_0730 [Desulfosporosinus metallidurans]